MRGNARFYRCDNDHVEPAPLGPDALQLLARVQLTPFRSKLDTVVFDGKPVGIAGTFIACQVYLPGDPEVLRQKEGGFDLLGYWIRAWSRSDPRHGKAILSLLTELGVPGAQYPESGFP